MKLKCTTTFLKKWSTTKLILGISEWKILFSIRDTCALFSFFSQIFFSFSSCNFAENFLFRYVWRRRKKTATMLGRWKSERNLFLNMRVTINLQNTSHKVLDMSCSFFFFINAYHDESSNRKCYAVPQFRWHALFGN